MKRDTKSKLKLIKIQPWNYVMTIRAGYYMVN